MRKSALIGVSLTLLMLLLVLTAAFIFLYQGRRVLEADRDNALVSLDQTSQELDSTYNNLEASSQALATADATNLLLEGQLVETQQEIDGMVSELATQEAVVADVTAERDQFLGRSPTIEIIAPSATDELIAGQPVFYDLFVSDVVGVTAVIVSVDDEQIDAFSLTGLPTDRVQGEWVPSELGEITLGVQASNARTSILVTRTLTVTNSTGQIVPLTEDSFQLSRSGVETAVSSTRQLQLANLDNVNTVNAPVSSGTEQTPLLANTALAQTLAVWNLFDFNPADLNLASNSSDFHYDPQQNQLNFYNDDGAFDAADAYAYASAFAHLLLDQTFEQPDQTGQPLDRRLAIEGVVSGDVGSVIDQLVASGFLETAVNTVQPSRLQTLLSQAGQSFVTSTIGESGYAPMNAVWNSMPVSTEQLLHPEKYVAQETPQLLSLPDITPVLGDGWSMLVEETLGEALLRVYLARHLNMAQVETAASGWGGDRFAVYQQADSEDAVLVFKIAWDTINDSNEFAALYPTYPTRLFTAAGSLNDGGECWEGDGVICLYQNEIETTIIRASTLELATEVGAFLFEE